MTGESLAEQSASHGLPPVLWAAARGCGDLLGASVFVCSHPACRGREACVWSTDPRRPRLLPQRMRLPQSVGAHQQAARALQTLGSLPLPSCVWRGQFTNVGPRLVSPAFVHMAGGSRPPPWAPTPPPNPPLHNSLHRRAPIQSARCSGARMQRPSANVSMCASSLYTREAYNCKAFSLFLEHHATLRSSPPPPDAVARAFGVCVRCRRARGPGAARRRLWPTCLPLFHFQPACPAGRSNAKECFPLSSFIAMPF